MKILLVHNFYKIRGGEDQVFENEKNLLIQKGHQVATFTRHNDDIENWWIKARTAWNLNFSREIFKSFWKKLTDFRPELVHVHNLFPQLTASVLNAAQEYGATTVMTLHNFRTICTNGLFLRDGRPCELCLPENSHSAIRHLCYRNSFAGSVSVSRMIDHHRSENTWVTKTQKLIALSEFAKSKFVAGGFSEKHISVKPNFFLPSREFDALEAAQPHLSQKLLFIGRLSPEKGLRVLASAWSQIAPLFPDVEMCLAGTGPEEKFLKRLDLPRWRHLGQLEPKRLFQELSLARALILPSVCYENFPLSLVEAMAFGIPCVTSRIGSLPEINREGETGLCFESGNADDLAEKIKLVLTNNDRVQTMGKAAKARYAACYTADKNYQELLHIYETALQH